MRIYLLFGAVLGLSAVAPMFFQAVIDGALSVPPATQAGEPEKAVPVASVKSVSVSSSGRNVRIQADDSGHYSADLKLNGRRVEGMIDTGATVVAINVSTARKIGISVASLDFRNAVQTANGPAKAAMARISSFEIGRIKLTDVDAVVLEDRALGQTLVGMSALSRLSRFKAENNVLLLEQ